MTNWQTPLGIAALALFLATEFWRRWALRRASEKLSEEERQNLSPGLRPQPYQRESGVIKDYCRTFDRIRIVQTLVTGACLIALGSIVLEV